MSTVVIDRDDDAYGRAKTFAFGVVLNSWPPMPCTDNRSGRSAIDASIASGALEVWSASGW